MPHLNYSLICKPSCSLELGSPMAHTALVLPKADRCPGRVVRMA